MKTHLLFAYMALFLMACGGSGKQKAGSDDNKEIEDTIAYEAKEIWYEGEMPILFDAKETYPETNIRLSDLSDALYIPLETQDDLLLSLVGTCEGNERFLTNDRIYIQEDQSIIYVFGRDGRFIRKIHRQGGGPEEYQFISSYVVDTLRQELFVQDGYLRKGNTLVYDMEGNFKRIFPNKAKEIASLSDSLLVNYFQYNPGGPRYSVTKKTDGSTVKELPIRFQVKLPHDSHGRLAYGSLIKSPQGVFLSNLANDTVFEIREDLKIYPRIIDKSDYGTTFAQVHPTIEMPRYLMFYILRSHNYKPAVDQHFYIYDKKEKQIYQMTDYTDNAYWVLMDDFPHVTNWETTQNSHVAVRTRLSSALFGAEGKHGDAQLKALIDTLDEDANPVLQVMIFHNVDDVKR